MLFERARFGEGNLRIDGMDGGGNAAEHVARIAAVWTPMLALGHGICAKGIAISGKSSRKSPARTLLNTPTICQEM
jgi:hypothetical protein